MFKSVHNIGRSACEFVSTLLREGVHDEDLSESDIKKITSCLNACLDDTSEIIDISDACITHLLFSQPDQRYYLTDGGDDDDDTFDKYSCVGETLFESLESFFVLCLEGSMYVHYSIDHHSSSVYVNMGEAFFMDVSTVHSLSSLCDEVCIFVVRCQLGSTLAHKGDRITSSSPVVYEKFCGFNYALVRLGNESGVIRDMIISNRRVYDAHTLTELDVVHISQVLSQYGIRYFPSPNTVPESSTSCAYDNCEQAAYEGADSIFAAVTPLPVVGIQSEGKPTIYYMKIVYGVLVSQ